MSDKMREEFEMSCVSFKDEFGLPLPIVKDKKGDYISEITKRAWYFWQASRAALVVELPLWRHNKGVQCYDLTEVKVALNKAGVSYK